VNIGEPCIALPSTQFPYQFRVNVIQEKGHSTGGPQEVGANPVDSKALVSYLGTDGGSTKDTGDSWCSDEGETRVLTEEGGRRVGYRTCLDEEASQGVDRVEGAGHGLVVESAVSNGVFLVVQGQGSGGSGKDVGWGGVEREP
jgi:hypothetical protein